MWISLAKPKSVSFRTPSGPFFVYKRFSGCKEKVKIIACNFCNCMDSNEIGQWFIVHNKLDLMIKTECCKKVLKRSFYVASLKCFQWNWCTRTSTGISSFLFSFAVTFKYVSIIANYPICYIWIPINLALPLSLCGQCWPSEDNGWLWQYLWCLMLPLQRNKIEVWKNYYT